MSHLNGQSLKRLLTGDLSRLDQMRIEEHVASCRGCARQLEEWRDTYPEVNEALPEVPRLESPTAEVTAGGVVFIPSDANEPRSLVNLTTILWFVAVLCAVAVGWLASRVLGRPTDTGGVAVLRPPAYTPSVNVAPFGHPDSAPGIALLDAPPTPAETATTRRPEPPPRAADAPEIGVIRTSPRFTRITLGDALRTLDGPVRGLAGLEPDHLERAGPGVVTGSIQRLPVIRVVYPAGSNSRILVDLQRIPVGPSGFRPVDDPRLESGDTTFADLAGGMKQAFWLDPEGYRIAVSAPVSRDSLLALIRSVR